MTGPTSAPSSLGGHAASADASPLDTAALPVVVVPGGNEEAVRSWVEGVLGWQPVDPGADHLVPPVLELRGLGSGPPSGQVPTILLVDDDAAPQVVGEVAARIRPDAVVAWPSGRDRLAAVAADLLGRDRPAGEPSRTLRVGGSAGGVGTTTVALALAGLAAWSGLRTFAALRGTGLGPRALPPGALAAPDVWSRSDPVVGVASLRAVVVVGGGAVPEVRDGSIETSVIDVGVDPDVDVLVCRPDAAALAVLPATTAAAVVMVGDGPAGGRDLARAASGRRGVRLPWSARVARAGLEGRVPAGLPGAWLARLEPLAPGGPERDVHSQPGTARRSRRGGA